MTVFLNSSFLLADYLHKGFDLRRYFTFIMNRSPLHYYYGWLIKRKGIKKDVSY